MKKLFVILLVLILNSISFSQSGWVDYSTGISKSIRGIYFINSNTGWFVGDTSAIFKTTNGGLNWISKPLSYVEPIALRAIKFLDNNTGYSVGGHEASGPYGGFYYQYIYKTTNGGDNWVLNYNVQGGGGFDFNDIYCNTGNIFVTGAGASGSIGWSSTGGILKSTNSGYNFTSSYSEGESTSLSFINSNTGWINTYYAVDYGLTLCSIMKTTNGGVNWIKQYRDSAVNFASMRINEIQFVNESTGFAIGNKSGTKFFKTTNGGTNWVINVFPNYENSTLFFVDPSTGWVGGLSNPDTSCISYTSNGGATWMKQKRNYSGTVNCLYFINGLTGWAGLNNGLIMKTTNGGMTFVTQTSSEVPSSYSLSQNYPNPFNPTTKIKFAMQKAGDAKVIVYDVMGREVQTLVNERLQAGTYETSFDGSALNSGVYFYKLITDGFSETKRMILIK